MCFSTWNYFIFTFKAIRVRSAHAFVQIDEEKKRKDEEAWIPKNATKECKHDLFSFPTLKYW